LAILVYCAFGVATEGPIKVPGKEGWTGYRGWAAAVMCLVPVLMIVAVLLLSLSGGRLPAAARGKLFAGTVALAVALFVMAVLLGEKV
jgi:hypothetical protein